MTYYDPPLKNLLAETLEVLKLNGKTTAQVKWVGSRDGKYRCDWETFSALASAINYDNGYGGAEIPEDLVVVGASWWLERGEYDGSEWWEFKSLPMGPEQFLPLRTILPSSGWGNTVELAHTNEEE